MVSCYHSCCLFLIIVSFRLLLFLFLFLLLLLVFAFFLSDVLSEQSANEFFALLQFFLEDCVLLEDIVLLLHHVLQKTLHSVDQLMHLLKLFVQTRGFLFGLLDFSLTLFDLQANLLELALFFKSIERASASLHGLSEALVLEKPIDDVSTTQVLNLFDIELNLCLEILYLYLILLRQLLNILVESLILSLFFLCESLVLSQQLDLLLEDLLIVRSHAMEYLVLLGVFLDDLAIHLCQILLGLVDEADDFSPEVAGIALCLELSDTVLQLAVLAPQLLHFGCAHLKYI